MTYGEIYKKALETIPQGLISDFRPENYSKGFRLDNAEYIDSIVIWLKNGDEIIYTVKKPPKEDEHGSD